MRFVRLKTIAASLAVSMSLAVADEAEQVTPVQPTLTWLTSLDEALEASKKSGKPILAGFR